MVLPHLECECLSVCVLCARLPGYFSLVADGHWLSLSLCVWAAVRFCEQWVSPKSLPGLGLGEAWGSGAFPSGNVERRRPFSTAPSRGGSSLLRWRKGVSLPATHMERNRTGSCPQLHPRKQTPAVTDVPNFPVDLLRVIRRTPPPICPLPLCASVLSLSSVILPSNSIIFFLVKVSLCPHRTQSSVCSKGF